MKLSRKKFPFLFSRDVNWFFAKDFRGEEHPFSLEDLDNFLHDDSLVRDYFSVAVLDKHWPLFDEVYLSDIMQHWKHFQHDSYLIMNNEGISILVLYREEYDEFLFIALKEVAIAAMIGVITTETNKSIADVSDYYFSHMLSEQKRNELKGIILNTFRISYAIKHFAPAEVKTVDEKNKKVQMGKGIMNKVVADSRLIVPVNIIDSSYLTTIIHIDKTSVRGHFRLQAHGKGYHDRRLIWIEPFEKGPYKRIAKKLKD